MDSSVVQKRTRRKNILVVVCYLLALIFIVAAYMNLKNPPPNGAYFVFTVLSTVGFGDISPSQAEEKNSRILATFAMFALTLANIIGSWDGPLPYV